MQRVTVRALSSVESGLQLGPADRTIPNILLMQADRFGNRPCLVVGGVERSYAELASAAAAFAGTLVEWGVERGDRVAILAENRWEILQTLLGCAWIGAVIVPINTASRGAQLEHILANADPKIVATEPGLMERVSEIARPGGVQAWWCVGDQTQAVWDGLHATPFPEPSAAVAQTATVPGDPLAILYTSGTTGPSKGVVCPHAQFYWWGVNVGSWLGLRADDTLYTCLPLFHTNALNAFFQALVHGAKIVIGPRFSVSQFWPRLAAAEATVTYLLGTMVSMLASGEPVVEERAHRLRVALAPATPPDVWEAFRSRFGIDLVEGHGMTETNAVVGPRDGEQRPGWLGRVMPGFDAVVVDEHDVPVADGTPGELVMRAREPFAFATGYWRMSQATVDAWRNLWFHTGDRVVAEDGWLRFIDRIKDAIRRRGENISAWEVEQVLLQHGSVESVAVIPVSSEHGEDDVMACVVARRGASLEPSALVEFCQPRLPYFAVPRYIEIRDDLPLTENGKIQKFLLRERGIGPTTWDREAAGIVVTR
jgi:crotonobetaine/carnitine-CoA ligase